MIAGQLAFLAEPADDPLENYHDDGRRAVDVESAISYLDDELTVQHGMVAGRVPKQEERVTLAGHEIETEQRDVERTVASEWVADVTGGGWILAERTHSSDREDQPRWPFSDFQTRTGRRIEPVEFAPQEFVRRQRDQDRDYTIEMASREFNGDDVSIEWGSGALKKDAIKSDVGVALTTLWDGHFVRLVVYGSGYLAIWEPEEMAIEAVARFVHEEVAPIAHVPEDDEETEQDTLEDESEREQVTA